jgi:hypothetical protein
MKFIQCPFSLEPRDISPLFPILKNHWRPIETMVIEGEVRFKGMTIPPQYMLYGLQDSFGN